MGTSSRKTPRTPAGSPDHPPGSVVASDCLYFRGDRPCVWHKQEGAFCICAQYVRQRGNVLVIKLDAMGDVLRTTCLLGPIVRRWAGHRVTWITRPESIPLLERNPHVTDIVPYGSDALLHLGSRSFDVVINLDAGRISSGMAAMANGLVKIGFLLDPAGYVTATNAAAEEWLRMGVFDNLKSANRRTYQEIMCGILGAPAQDLAYVLEVSDEEMCGGAEHLRQLGLDLSRKIIGMHTGGGRWSRKQWGEDCFAELIRRITVSGEQVLLFGGPSERETNARIIRKASVPIFDAGSDNGVRHFASLVGHCAVVLSGDTLAMHVALAMGRRVVVLFGPTSSHEIELFGLGEKIVPAMGCLCCYRLMCERSPHCMETIAVPDVERAIRRQLAYESQPTS